MSPIESIAEGIREGNWETVCKGYEHLTGETIPPPTTSNAGEMLWQIADIIESYLLLEQTKKPQEPEKKKRGRPKGGGKKNTTITKDGEDASLQLDEGSKTKTQKQTGETQLITNNPDPEEIAINRVKAARAQKNKLKLDRKATKIYKVKCNECETLFDSNRPEGKMGQKCSKCLKEKKSRFS